MAALVRELGDFELAEESAQEALLAALERWPRDGIPDRPDAWLVTVGRRRAIASAASKSATSIVA